MASPPAEQGSGSLFTSGSLAEALGARLSGPADIALDRLNTLEGAGPRDATFVRSKRYAEMWPASKAGACIVSAGVELPSVQGRGAAILVVSDADLALIRAIELFCPPRARPASGVHATALVDASARIDPTASVGPMCVVEEGCVVGSGAILRARVMLGAGVKVGDHSELEPGVVVHHGCEIGRHCLVHSNCVIGADGFGFRPSPDGRGVVKIPHAGNVEIHDHVELGACTCVDRGKFGPTVIGAGSKLDNHVQVAHNVRIGRSCLIAGCTGVAGSVVIEDGVMIGGHCGIGDNLRVGRGARLGAFSAVMSDVPAGQTVVGVPAMPHVQFFREKAMLSRLTEERRAKGDGPGAV